MAGSLESRTLRNSVTLSVYDVSIKAWAFGTADFHDDALFWPQVLHTIPFCTEGLCVSGPRSVDLMLKLKNARDGRSETETMQRRWP